MHPEPVSHGPSPSPPSSGPSLEHLAQSESQPTPKASQSSMHPARTMTRSHRGALNPVCPYKHLHGTSQQDGLPSLSPSHPHSGLSKVDPRHLFLSLENRHPEVKQRPPQLTGGKPKFEFRFNASGQPSGSHHLAVWQPHVELGQDHSGQHR